MLQDDLFAALEPVIVCLENLGVKYYIGGSVASSSMGLMRATMDVDVIATLRQEHVVAFVQAIDGPYYVGERMIREAIERESCFNVVHQETGFKVDVFIAKARKFDQEALRRIQCRRLASASQSHDYWVASPEDMVLKKLEWYEMLDRSSERQWNDVRSILKTQKENLDFPYLHHWAAELNLSDLLSEALADAGIDVD